jgi:predicted O-methyltransferase YrrM
MSRVQKGFDERPPIHYLPMSKSRHLFRSLRLAVAHPGRTARGFARLPLEQQAATRIAGLPLVEIQDLLPPVQAHEISLPSAASRHRWSLGTAEQIILQLIIRERACVDVFEIGTFNGGTTRLLAEVLPENGHVWTIDLAEEEFDATQGPNHFSGRDVGAEHRRSPVAHKVHQLFGNSLTFDFSPFEGRMDLVLVDGGHEYPNGLHDSLTALRLVRPGGIILWDDFDPYWHGLISGICDAMKMHRLGRLSGRSFAVYVSGRPLASDPH